MPCPKASCMPSAVVGAQIVGHLRPEIARELGLTGDVAVAPGSGDNQMSALGAGAVKEGTWVVSLGTSGDMHSSCLYWQPSLPMAHLGGVPRNFRHSPALLAAFAMSSPHSSLCPLRQCLRVTSRAANILLGPQRRRTPPLPPTS